MPVVPVAGFTSRWTGFVNTHYKRRPFWIRFGVLGSTSPERNIERSAIGFFKSLAYCETISTIVEVLPLKSNCHR